ncbi:MAG: hypothetical protein KDA22_12735 [Phycisphaerales bacterium]|nr:hypothetical protein [Phycisphaerales bacterium]
MNVIRFCMAVAAYAGATIAFAGEQSALYLIDFEEYAEETPISTQYAALGVVFSVEGDPRSFPIIAIEGAPRVAFSGGGNDSPMSSLSGGLTDPLVNGQFDEPGTIRMDFDPPVTSVRFFVIDIDGGESFTATASSGANIVAAVTRSAGDPGTGNGVSTEFFLEGDEITSVVVGDPDSNTNGWAIDFLTFTRPCEGAACGPVLRVAQESAPGVGDFDDHVLADLLAFPSSGNAASFYAYDVPEGDSWNGPALTPEADRSHLLLATTSEGISLFIVHDRAVPNDPDGGKAEMSFEVLGDFNGAAITVKDDPDALKTAFGYAGEPGDSLFLAGWDWGTCCTDGLALSGLDTGSSVIVQFTEVDGNPNTPPIQGLSEWVAYSSDGTQVPMALEIDRRVRIEVIAGGGTCPADLNGDGQVDGADLGILLGAWGPCALCPADLNTSGSVDGADLGVLLGAWGPCPARR